MDRTVVNIALITDVHHIRTDLGDLSDLETSIARFGLLHPVIVDSKNRLISGARRLQACRNLGFTEIQALRVQTAADSLDALVIYSDENLCRRTLSAAEMDALIQLKKSMMGSRSGSIWGRLKKLFSWLRSK